MTALRLTLKVNVLTTMATIRAVMNGVLPQEKSPALRRALGRFTLAAIYPHPYPSHTTCNYHFLVTETVVVKAPYFLHQILVLQDAHAHPAFSTAKVTCRVLRGSTLPKTAPNVQTVQLVNTLVKLTVTSG